MEPNQRFLNLPKSFWANVRTISEGVGYTTRAKTGSQVKVPNVSEMLASLETRKLDSCHVASNTGEPTPLGELLLQYFDYRANVLNDFVQQQLMDLDTAEKAFEAFHAELRPSCPLPWNKQKGDKRTRAYFTGIINMLIQANAQGFPCDYDPQQLTTITRNKQPLRTLARRIDGAFPSAVNPVAVWEIKEYYHTRTFGSRVADGVYESLLDGMELEELREHEGAHVLHYLMLDDHYTWWKCSRSYLCRIIDMLNMGYLDEVLFGREVLDRLPCIVQGWVGIARQRHGAAV